MADVIEPAFDGTPQINHPCIGTVFTTCVRIWLKDYLSTDVFIQNIYSVDWNTDH